MPTGKVKFFDAAKGFGFIVSDEDGAQVFLPSSALPEGLTPRKGQRVSFGLADTRRGPQALNVEPITKLESLARKNRRSPEETVVNVEDLIRLLDGASTQLRRGRYPEGGGQIARALRAVADDFDA